MLFLLSWSVELSSLDSLQQLWSVLLLLEVGAFIHIRCDTQVRAFIQGLEWVGPCIEIHCIVAMATALCSR